MNGKPIHPSVQAMLDRVAAKKKAERENELTKQSIAQSDDALLAELFSECNERPNQPQTQLVAQSSTPTISTNASGKSIVLNSQQQRAIDLGLSGKSCIILGAAGTGKTTILRELISRLLSNHDGLDIPMLRGFHKYLESGTPGIVITSFTRRSVQNDKRNVSADMQRNVITHHKLLEFEPEVFEVYDPETDKFIRSRRFVHKRTAENPLPPEIKIVFINEASMTSLDLYQKIAAALPPDTVFIFTGDIQQLPPVFGHAILGYKMLELPVIELTEVHRQALDSPILRLAHRILSGKPIYKDEFPSWNEPDKLQFYTWKKKFDVDDSILIAAKLLTSTDAERTQWIAKGSVTSDMAHAFGSYDPMQDMVLIPFNKGLGTLEFNKLIAQTISTRLGRAVHEVRAGRVCEYFSIGDKVLCDKEDGIIRDIRINPQYLGTKVQESSVHLNYWGKRTDRQLLNARPNAEIESSTHSVSIDDMDFSNIDDHILDIDIAKVNQASHIIEVELLDGGTILLNTSAEIANLLLSYALTVHKAQGCEWRRVYMILHQSHAVALQRELLYTAVTRAKEELYIICEEDSFVRGILYQKIKGNTLAEKAEYFKGKKERGNF